MIPVAMTGLPQQMYHCIQAFSKKLSELGSVPVYKSAPYTLVCGLKADASVWLTKPAAPVCVNTSMLDNVSNQRKREKGKKREYGDGVEREKQLEMMMSGKSRKMKFNVFFSHFFSMFFILVFSFLGKRPLIRRENLKKKGILNREFYKLYTSVAGELRFCKLL